MNDEYRFPDAVMTFSYLRHFFWTFSRLISVSSVVRSRENASLPNLHCHAPYSHLTFEPKPFIWEKIVNPAIVEPEKVVSVRVFAPTQ